MPKTKKCRKCRGPMVFTKVEHPYWQGITLVALVQDVPSWVCELCGDNYFDPTVENTLRYLVQDYIKMGGLFPVPTTPYRTMAQLEKAKAEVQS